MIKKGITILLLLLIINTSFGAVLENDQSKKSKDPWLGLDKLKHLSSSFILTTSGYYIQTKIADIGDSRSLTNSGIITISLGLGKEITDLKKSEGIFSFRDLTADIAGIGLALIFIRAIL